MRQLYAWYAYVANESTQRLVEEGMSTGLTNAHTARRFSVLYHLFALKTMHTPFCVSLPYQIHSARVFARLLVGTTVTSFQVDTNNNYLKLFDGI